MLTNFKTYHLAVELYRECEQIKTKYYLKDQLPRASLSIILNTAEGSAKSSAKERGRFYGIALASCRETQVLLTLLKQEKTFKLADQIGGCLYRLINH